jgi:hypothetical protein
MASVVLGVAAAVAASGLYNAGVALQSLEARSVSSRHSLRLSLLRHLAGRGRWIAGTFLTLLAWPLHVAALLIAPLTLVQPALAAGLLLLLAIGIGVLGESVGKRELAGVLAIVVGMAGLAWAAPTRSTAHADAPTLALALAGLGAAALAPYVLRWVRPGRPTASVIAALSAGVAFSWTGLTTKLFSDAVASGTWLFLFPWLAATALASGVAVLSEMTALQTRPVTQVAPVVFVVQTLVPVLLAPFLTGEAWSSTPFQGAALAVSLATVAVGAAALTSSSIVGALLSPEATSSRTGTADSPSRDSSARRSSSVESAPDDPESRVSTRI